MNHKENVKNGKSPKFDVQYMQYYQNRGSFLSAEKPCHVFLLNTQDECNAFLDIASINGPQRDSDFTATINQSDI